MQRSTKRLVIAAATLVLPLLLGGCGGSPSTLDAAGPKGAHVTTLWWVLFGISAFVFVVVFVLLLRALFHAPPEQLNRQGKPESTTFVTLGGAIIPAIVLVGVFGYVLWIMHATASPAQPASLTVQVIGHRWWWEIRYPGQHVITANELHVPVGQPVTLQLTSADVIHSFWVPQIQQKTDMIPGRINTTWFQADKAGVYTGECAEYCGAEHARMDFMVVAQPPAQFQRWLVAQQQPAPQPNSADLLRGQQIFLGSACVYCHAVMGTNASGRIGPDLTHLASRLTIGAGILPNTVGNLAGWIANPQTIKPDNAMPPMAISPGDMQPLLDYLESLK